MFAGCLLEFSKIVLSNFATGSPYNRLSVSSNVWKEMKTLVED